MSNIQQTNFTGGEMSPSVYGRTDQAKYYDGCALLENMIILDQGGATRRGGSRFIAESKYHDKKALLMEFIYSTVQAYLLEIGHQYIRFYKDGGQIQAGGGGPYELSTPWTEADLEKLSFAQSVDTLFITHPNHQPRRLVRMDHNDWRLHFMKIDRMPLTVDEYEPPGTLTPGAVSGSGINFTASDPVFLAGDVGCGLKAKNGAGRAEITALVSASVVTCTILDNFDSTGPIASGQWVLTGGPRTGQLQYDAAHYASGILTNQYYAPGIGTNLNCTSDIFRPADVGKYARILGGCIKIIGYATAQQVQFQIIRDLPVTTSEHLTFGVITIEAASWSSVRGWPWHLSFKESRLLAGGSNSQPETVWGSESGNFFDFLPGGLDADPFEWTLAGAQVNAIQWMAAAKRIFVGTLGAEFVLGGGAEPLGPNNPDFAEQTFVGCKRLRPALLGNTLFFVGDVTNRLYIPSYQLDNDSFQAEDLNILADHLPEGGSITDLAAAKGPQGVIWEVRSDGMLLGLSFQKKHEVLGWHRHPMTNGAVEQVACIPGSSRYETWLLVKRTIGGAAKRYIELMEHYKFAALEDCFYVDAGLTGEYAAPTAVITGLGHLEGQTVSILAAGAVHPQRVVSGGQVTLQQAVTGKVHAGLPMTSKLLTLPLATPGNVNTIRGAMKRVREVVVWIFQSLGLKLGPDEAHLEEVPFRKAGDPMDSPPPLFTGPKTVKFKQGHVQEPQVLIIQDHPLPLTVQGAVIRFETADGQ